MRGALAHRQVLGPLASQGCPSRPQIAARPNSAAAAARCPAQPLSGVRRSPLVSRPPPLPMQQSSRPAERGCAVSDTLGDRLRLCSMQCTHGPGTANHRPTARQSRHVQLQDGRQDDGDGTIRFRQVLDALSPLGSPRLAASHLPSTPAVTSEAGLSTTSSPLVRSAVAALRRFVETLTTLFPLWVRPPIKS